MADLRVNIGALSLKNPVMTASGTFGYGLEFADFMPLDGIGGIIVKGTTLHPRQGNDYPRMAETASGMLNCVGLQNKGVDYFCEHIYPQIKDIDTNMIVNVSGSSPEDYAACAAKIDALEHIPAIELNISCPNVKDGGMAFGVTCAGASSVVKAVRKAYHKTLIVKLSPNVTDITEIARAVEAEGADSVSLINTLMGMAIDIEKRKTLLSINTGGLSGPAVKPVALRMVWQVAKAVKIPVVGLGGITSAKDAIEFLMAGATAIEIGTANFLDPAVSVKVEGLIGVLGGPRTFEEKLDSLFTEGRYWHGNEPCHQIAYLYDFIGKREKTIERVAHILDTEYNDTPGGLSGNDDAGQMSAWYVFSSMGFYPVCPATNRYMLAVPRFQKVTLNLQEGRSYTITPTSLPQDRNYITQEEIIRGN